MHMKLNHEMLLDIYISVCANSADYSLGYLSKTSTEPAK